MDNKLMDGLAVSLDYDALAFINKMAKVTDFDNHTFIVHCHR
ncbi:MULTISPECIES: hypothetical protein [Moraxella]|nr:hypothetical protein [Moraxella sp. ZY171148]